MLHMDEICVFEEVTDVLLTSFFSKQIRLLTSDE